MFKQSGERTRNGSFWNFKSVRVPLRDFDNGSLSLAKPLDGRKPIARLSPSTTSISAMVGVSPENFQFCHELWQNRCI